MDKERNSNNSYVFGLDIGTRSVVGVVGYLEYGRLSLHLKGSLIWNLKMYV